MTEDVQTSRQRAKEEDSVTFSFDLSVSLKQLSVKLDNFGRKEEAATYIKEAIEIQTMLARQDVLTFGPELADTLRYASTFSTSTNMRGDAFDIIKNAKAVLSDVPEPTSKDKGKEISEYHIARTDPSVKSVIETKDKARVDAQSGMLTFLSKTSRF